MEVKNVEKIDKGSLYYIFLEILRLHHYRTHVLLEEIGIYPGQPPLLFILNKKDGQSQKEIAEKLKITPATLTVMLKRMEKVNLVERKQDVEDQRISRVYLTDRGREICNKAMEVIKNLEEECFGNFTVEEKIILRRLLMQMRDNLSMQIENNI